MDQEVAADLRPKKFPLLGKNFLCLEIAEVDIGVNFGSRRTILDIKTHFLKLNPFSGGK